MTTRRRLLCGMALFASAVALALPARADIRVGVVLSITDPAAVIGTPSENTVQVWPATIGSQHAQVIVLDDASDPSMAVRDVRKLIVEDKVDVIVGLTIVPTALASLDAVAKGQTPMITLVALASIVEPQNAKRRWALKMPQSDSQMATLITQHMANNGVHTIGFIGFTDAYGENWWREFSRLADVRKSRVVANERFTRTDTSVTGQILKLTAAKPDAILTAGVGTPAALPQCTLVEHGYKGRIYQTHGIASTEFLKMGGKDVESTLFPTGPAVVACELSTGHPVRKVAVESADRYEAKYGPNTITQFVGDAWGAWQLLGNATARAPKTSTRPGIPAFRATLRDALETTRDLTVPNGVLNLNTQDHQGFDQRLRVMGIIRSGRFAYAGPR